MYVLVGVVAVLILAFLIFSFYAASKESEVTARYEGVYGRMSARLAVTLTALGVIFPIVTVVLIVLEGFSSQIFPIILFALVSLLIGILLFVNAFKKCPEHLKDKLIISMVITALGSSLKRTGKAAVKTAEAVRVAAVLEGGFAPNYTLKSFDGSVQVFETVSVEGDYAKLYNNATHEIVEVWAYKDGYYVTDRFGNLYAPK